MFRSCRFVAFVLIFGAFGVGFAEARQGSKETAQSAFASTAGATSIPIGWHLFCQEHQAECHAANASSGGDTVSLDEDKWKALLNVNRLVNQNIAGVTDDEHYHIYAKGIANWWTYPDDGMGNCNDYAILKKRLLVEAGWSSSALFLTVVLDHQNEGHLVLMARTDRGDLILDNLTDRVVLWRETGYTFLKRQSSEDPDVWVAFTNDVKNADKIATLSAAPAQQP